MQKINARRVPKGAKKPGARLSLRWRGKKPSLTVVPSTYVRDSDDAVMVEVKPDQYVSQQNLGPNGQPLPRKGSRGQYVTKEDKAEPAVAVLRGKRQRIIPLARWFGAVNNDQLSYRWWTSSGSEATYGRKLPDPIPDLTRARWFTPRISRDEERELILQSRAGDVAAGNNLLKRFSPLLRKIAWLPGFDALGDDRMAIAAHGLAKAIAGCDVNAVTGLAPYAQLCVRGTLRDAMKLLRKKGFKNVPAGEWPELKGGNAVELETGPTPPSPWADFDEIPDE